MTTTDDFDELDELDELASAYLDGETTDEETARVESDPAILARVDVLRQAIEAVAQPVAPAPPEARAAAIAAALAHHSPVSASPISSADKTTATSQETAAPDSTVIPIDRKPADRGNSGVFLPPRGAPLATPQQPNRWQRFGRIGSVAAALLVAVVIGGIALRGLSSDSGEETASMATSADVSESSAAMTDDDADTSMSDAGDSDAEATSSDDSFESSAADAGDVVEETESFDASADSSDDADSSMMAESAPSAMDESAMDEGTMTESADGDTANVEAEEAPELDRATDDPMARPAMAANNLGTFDSPDAVVEAAREAIEKGRFLDMREAVAEFLIINELGCPVEELFDAGYFAVVGSAMTPLTNEDFAVSEPTVVFGDPDNPSSIAIVPVEDCSPVFLDTPSG